MLQPSPSSLILLLAGDAAWLTQSSLIVTLGPPSQSGWRMAHSLLTVYTETARPTQWVVGQHMTDRSIWGARHSR